ncbi:FAD-binding protein [Neorhizobium lilium]|uniref:Tryptophan 2-monooxygenase n=1 Tax=Neorhizobium lilium TaxID=2503024 RepID=A0A444LD75_9HYPH|nr:NAD(P)/FAD-dependent oxidoreductase [Neorhizobium lilium]RWX75796.1 FAD-binding protein [Neorhizobium lilium]
MTSEPDIVIIGAGAAGIGAARRLAGSGLSVMIIEALARTGGRAWTHPTPLGPLDLGCGWLHTAEHNPWVGIADQANFPVERRASAWGRQFRNLGFSPAEQQAAGEAFEAWNRQLAEHPPHSDRASDALDLQSPWTAYIQAISGFINGDETERISAQDYSAYDEASSDNNWRLPQGYGALITSSLPAETELHLDTPLVAVDLNDTRVSLETTVGHLRPHAVIFTASTNVLASDTIRWPSELDAWRDAAKRLPLGHNEKLFIEITGSNTFEPETHVLGDPKDAATGSYYIRPFGYHVIECYLGGAGARAAAAEGTDAAFAHAIDQLVALFGSSVRGCLRPLIASDWAHSATIRGAYSHALPGEAEARSNLARPYDDRIFFAGEATHRSYFSTAHGAYLSGIRAADEAVAVLGRKKR